MRETSDTMQELAQAFGERTAMEYTLDRMKGLTNNKNKELISLVARLFALDIIDRDLPHYVL